MTRDPRQAGAPRLASARRRAGAAILVERVFPSVLGLASVAAVFLILSWFGVFASVAPPVRWAVLAALGLAALLVLWRARRLRLPGAEAVDRRIEATSRLDHRPLAAQSERPISDDPFALALWREHQRRMAEQLRDLSAGAPRTEPERLDPFALRAVVAMLLVTAFAFSYGSRGGAIGDAFRGTAGPILAGARVDAWVTPPTYTGLAPVFLAEAAGTSPAAIKVPAGSVLSVRVSDGTGVQMRYTPTGGSPAVVAPGPLAAPEAAGQAAASPAAGTAAPPASSAGVYEVRLAASGAAELSGAFSRLGAWRFEVTPDVAPTIAFSAEPTTARNGAMELGYTVGDDYGVRRGTVEIELAGDGDVAPGARPLAAAPEINLAMPRRAKGEAKGRTLADITESPYAGATVAMTLVALDDAGQSGRSETKSLRLPQRRFANPLARAVVEQRRILALDANAAQRVVGMLDAVTLRGEDFIEDPGDYLALRAARTRIATAANDETLLSAVDFLWEIALGIEDGNLSLAEKRLRDAREQLSEALDKGAGDEEIDRLVQELREAMQEYMQAMAEAMKNQPPMSQEQMANLQELRPQDLDKMLDRIEDLAKSGSKDAAKELLSELQSMMDNLQAMQQPGQPGESGEQSAMQQQMDKLGEMLRRQQALKDQTFDLGRRQVEEQQRRPRQPGEDGEASEGGEGQPMSAEALKEALEKLQAEQGQLRKELGEMQEAMKGMGLEPGEGFGEAGKAMGRAEGALEEGDDGGAVGEQGQAMEALRRGAKDMMSQMQQAMQAGQGQQPGSQGQMGEGYGRGQQRSGRDPLGRQRATQGPDFGQDVDVPDEIDTQRARRILDSIRQRLGNQLSPAQERDYLERLLKTP